MEARLYRIKVFKEKTPYFWVAYALNMKNFIITGHEHSTRDSRGQRLISINPVVTEQNHKVLNNHTAPSLRASFIRMRDTQYDYQLRNRETDLVIPKPRSEYLKKSFKYSGTVMWNALSTDAKSSDRVSLNNFKRLSGF